ncbi:MAG: hypothetical protein R2867_13260 [Caldilineaceae bacterium]
MVDDQATDNTDTNNWVKLGWRAPSITATMPSAAKVGFPLGGCAAGDL